VFTLTPVAESASSTATRVGWTIGAGITGLSDGLLTSRYSSHITDNILRVGLNYRWAAR
jgi:hypothetical protein